MNGRQQTCLEAGHHDSKRSQPGYRFRATSLMHPDTQGGESHCGHTRSSK